MASSGDTLMFVASASGDVTVLDSLGALVRSFGSAPDIAAGGIAVGGGRVYVSGTSQRTAPGPYGVILVLDLNGSSLGAFHGGVGDSLGQVGGIALRDSSLWICDVTQRKLKLYRPDGRFVRSFGTFGTGDGQWSRPSQVAFTDDGHLLA